MKELELFRKAAEDRNLCAEYRKRWDESRSNKQLFDIAMDSNGNEYVCKAVAEGWFLPIEFVLRRFRMYINGAYISKQKGYTSKMYVKHKDNIIVNTTNLVLIECRSTIHVPKNVVCNIYLANSQVKIGGEGTCYIKKYGRSAYTQTKTVNIV